MADITYNDKDNISAIGTPERTWRAEDANEVKEAVNTKSDKLLTANAKTTSYTLNVTDSDKMVSFDISTDANLTIEQFSTSQIPVKFVCYVKRIGDGTLTFFAGTGVTITSQSGDLLDGGSNFVNGLYHESLNSWILFNGAPFGNIPNLAEILSEGNDADGTTITGLPDPVDDTDAAPKSYVDDSIPADQDLASVLAIGNNANGATITNLPTPNESSDAATKGYVDSNIGGGVAKIFIRNPTSGNTYTGNGTETILDYVQISGSTFQANDEVVINALQTKSGTAGVSTMRIRVQTADPAVSGISGGQVIATLAGSGATSVYNRMQRIMNFLGALNSQIIHNATSTAIATDFVSSTAAALLPAIDFSVTQYMLCTVALAGAADTVTLRSWSCKAFR